MKDIPNVLIVEDEAIIAQDLKATLMNLDYRVVDIVSSGDGALEILERESVDVILMDIRIKGDKNGIQTTNIINVRFDVPVIFLTAYADAETMERIKNADAYGFIVKPASEQTIQGSIDLALYKHGLDRKLREREERLAHLNQVLLAIRNVNQLITKEKDIHKLIQGACDNLIQSLGYSRAWIALYNGEDKLSTFSFAGFRGSADPLINLLKGEKAKLPSCIQKAFDLKEEMVITDTSIDCDNCQLKKEYRQYSRFSMCLSYSEKIYGVMSVAVPSRFVHEKEEQELFKELVEDVAFALYRLELEDKRRYAETMLKNRERTLTALMNNIPGIAYRRLNDEHWTIHFISNGCVRILGYQPIELIKSRMTLKKIIHPDDQERVKTTIESAVQNSRQYDLMYRIVTMDDELKWVWERGSATGDKEGTHDILEGVIHDITEQRHAEEALSKEKSFTEMALNSQKDTFFVFDPDTGRAVRWNKTFENVSGYTTKEIKELPVPDSYFNEEDINKAEQLLPQIMKEKVGMIEASLITKDGNAIPYEYRITSMKDPETEKLFLISVGRDITERKLAEEALKKSEEKLRNIIEHSNELYFIHDTENNLNFVSPQCQQIMGYTADEMKMKWTRLTTDHPVNKEGSRLTMKAMKTGKRQPCYPLEVRKKSGESIWIEIDESPLKDEGGKVRGMVGAIRDITMRRQAEQALKESEEKYRALVENMTDSVFMVDKKNRILSMNESACRFLHISNEQAVGISVSELFPKELAKKYAMSIRKVFASGEPMIVERKTSIRNQLFWLAVSLSPVKDAQGNVTCVIGVSRDISERKQMEEALIQSESRFRAIVEDQTEFIIRWLPDGTRTYVNDAYCRYYGKPYEALVGEKFFPLIHEKDRGRLKAKIKALTPENPAATDEHRRIMPDGEVRWHQWTDRALFNEKGTIREIQSVGRDITQRKLAENEVRHANVRMRGILENTDEFIMIADKEGKTVMFNSAYARLCREMIGLDMKPGLQAFRKVQDKKFVKWWIGLHDRVLKGEKFNVEFSWPDKAMEGRYFETHFYPIFEENEIRGFTEFTRDISDRKLAEKALKESEVKYYSLFNQSVEGIFLHDLDGAIHDVNQMACVQTGYSRDELINLNIFKFLKDSEESREWILREWRQWKPEERYSYEGEHIRKDGTVYPVQVSTGIVSYGDENLVLAIVQDISIRKQTEARIRENERFITSVFDSIQDGLSILNPDLTIRAVNGIMNQWYAQHTPLEGKKCYFCYQGKKKACDPCPSLRCIHSKKTEFDVVPGLPGSPVKWIELYSYPIIDSESGEVTGVVEFVRDISRRKESEDALQQSEALLKKMAENYPHSYLAIIDKSMRASFASGQEFKRTDMEPENYIGLPVENIFGDNAPIVRKNYMKTFRGKQALFELKMETQCLQFKTVPLHDEMGKVSRILVVAENITERKQAEEALKANEEKLKNMIMELQAIINALPGMVSVIDLNYNVLIENEAVIKRFGQSSPDQVIRKKCYQVRKGLKHVCPQCAIKKAFKTGQPVSRVSTPEEERMGIAFKTYAVPLKNSQGKIWAGVEVIIDITDLSEAEREITNKVKELEKFNKLMVGRENRMIELKREVNMLCRELGKRKKYRVPDEI